jgi:subtilase family serine protease/flagellar hook assembly protein FlgD/fibronectin type 3 domain-containing protein
LVVRLSYRRASVVLSLLLLNLSSGLLWADRLEPVRSARQRARSLAPLAATDSGITRDIGPLAVVEHDGSSYDMFEADGVTPNEAARARVARRFYETHGDNYDFLVVFTNFEFSTPGLLAFFNPVRNDVSGIGLPPVDRGSLYGSPGRLKGYVDMAAVDRYRQLPQSLEPGTRGFLQTLGVLSHEVGHQWLARPRYRNGSGQLSGDLLGRAGSHWSYLLDSDASVMHGSDWVANGNGTFTAARTWDGYSPLDLYLMGLLDPARVSPFTLLRNPAVDPTGVPVEGATVSAVPEAVTVDQVIAAEGPRAPSHLLSPKEFRLGFIVLTAPGTEPSAEDLEAVERVRSAFAGYFFAITRGVAVADTTLAEEPPPPPAVAPDLDRALGWLVAQQSLDGRWEDAPGTALRDTASAVEVLIASAPGTTALERGRTWLHAAPALNADYLARRARALSPLLSPAQKSALADAILAGQTSSGGFGLGPGYEADALDTALALRALASLGHPRDQRIHRAFTALAALRHPSGGWAAVEGREVSTLVTAQVLLAIRDWPEVGQAQPLLAPALAALLARQNPDGGFGESPSTAYTTALAVDVLSSGGPAPALDGAISWLHRTQLSDGSWGASRYQTALVIAALRGRFGANLTVPASGLVLDPPTAEEGATVHVTARVRNAGSAQAGPQRTRLYDGDPSLGRMVGETVVGPLGPGEEATIAFDFPTEDRAGTRTLYVVADALHEVRESREDDNAASRALQVDGLLPDLEITPLDITVSPDPPEEGETVTVAVTVHNRSERTSLPVLLQIARGNPRAGGALLGQATLPAVAAGGQATLSFPWDTTGLRGSHELFAVVDGNFGLEELDEDNNQAFVLVTVSGPLPPGPDLEIALVQPVPARLATIPQALAVSVSVRNRGRDAVSSTVALRGGPEGPPLGEQAVSLSGRSSAILTFPVEVASPGNHVFWAVADPAGTVSETSEDNNRASGVLVDGRDTLDVEIRPTDVTPSSTDLVVGQPLVVTAIVRNRGTAPIANVPVMLAHVTPSGPAELVRQTVTLDPGATFTASFTWTITITGESVPLAVVADPFGLLAELSEANNRADLSVRIRPSAQPNLTLSGADITFAPDPPLEGASATVSALIRNPGAVGAGAFAVRFFRGDPDQGGTSIGEASVPGLAAGATVTAQVAWSPVNARGAQGVFVVVDPDGQVDEYDEADNRAFRPFSVLGLPDLVLAAADVALVPAYPRAGEPVAIRATVRNLGGQPSGPAVLRAYEGELGSGTVIGSVAVPDLAIGQAITLELAWTPATPPGERTLSLAADADDQVREQDEGNNTDRRSVVVQDADLYLTELYFSPDGDGVKDETVLAYRATGPVRIVVSDSLGQGVRTLAASAPAEGSITWDGRNDRGRLMPDSTYFLSVIGAGNETLGRAQVVLDTNRSPIHDAAGTRQIAIRNITCRLPNMVGPIWMPSEDEWLFIVREAQGPFSPGLLRVGADGHHYVGGPDPWYASGSLIDFEGAVAPDGREVLIERRSLGELYLVDLTSGQRRLLAAGSHGRWSPDGRFILVGGNSVYARDGSLVTDLPQHVTAWSPDGESLVGIGNGVTILRRDGSFLREIPYPTDVDVETVDQIDWREDGKIFAVLSEIAPEIVDREPTRAAGSRTAATTERVLPMLLDPETGAWEEVSWLTSRWQFGRGALWSPDGSKLLRDNLVLRADGADLRVVPSRDPDFPLQASPRLSSAWYGSGEDAQPGRACHGFGDSDVFVVNSLQNLTADLQVSRLPGNNGLLVRGTVSDRHLERSQLDYALTSDPETWHPVGAASEVPVLDDVLGVWVPPAPGSYLLRLRVSDRAGNERLRTRAISWDRVPVLANITQDESLISPTGDGVKDAVRFRYLVQEPTRLEVRILGPLPSEPSAPPPPTVRRLSFDYPDPGPATFVWDGRDDGGRVVADGRYTVLLNDLPLRVEVDATPPDIAFAYSNLRTHSFRKPPGAEGCPFFGALAAARSWHVVDSHLKSWKVDHPRSHLHGTEPVHEFERDASGQIVYENGLPRVLRRNGRVVDSEVSLELYLYQGKPFVAEDHAGNRSVVPILSLEDRVFLLTAEEEQPMTACPPDLGILPPLANQTYSFRPVMAFDLHRPFPDAPIVFQYRRSGESAWIQVPVTLAQDGLHEGWAVVNFVTLGLDRSREHDGRFSVTGPSGTLHSEAFAFKFCDAVVFASGGRTEDVPGTDLARYRLGASVVIPEPVGSVTLNVTGDYDIAGFRAVLPMQFNAADGIFEATVVAPRVDPELHCADPHPLRKLGFEVVVRGVSGRLYRPGDRFCGRNAFSIPECNCNAFVRQEPESCSEASPDHVRLEANGLSTVPDAIFRLERGPADDPIVLVERAAHPHTQLPVRLTLDTTGIPEGDLDLRSLVIRPNAPPDQQVCARHDLKVWIDRTAPAVEVFQPAEGGTLCVTPDLPTGRETARLLIDVRDFARVVEIVASEYRFESGEWHAFPRLCRGLECQGQGDPTHLPTGRTSTFTADVTGFPEGEYTLRLTVCDGTGNTRTVLRRFLISRQPPSLALAQVSRPVFSPNGDSRADDSTVTVRTFQALGLTVEVRQGDAAGPLLRSLVSNQTFAAGDHPFVWDGRDSSGAPVAEGRYVLVVSGADPCGGTGRLVVPLEVDLTPPQAIFTSPTSGLAVATSVDARGFASDLHFLSYELAFGEGSAPAAWTTIRTSTLAVGAGERDGLLGRWDPPSTQGPYTLRLIAADRAENTAEARVTVNVAPRAYLERLAVTPTVFSPNGDGRRETATLEYELRLTGRVSLQVRDPQDALVRTLEGAVEHGAGLQAFTWDGRNDAGSPAPDGEYRLWIRVEDPGGVGGPQEQAVAFGLDRTPPQVLIERPAPGVFLTRGQQVRGTVSDDRLSLYVVEATPEGGAPVELLRGSQSRIAADLAPLTVLTDGPHTLTVRAEDEGENRAQAEVGFTMDSLPPVARLLAPTAGAVVRKGSAPVDVSGTAMDANLQEWLLSFGAGPEPAHFVEIARGNTAAAVTRLAGWAVSGLPDGVYTLRLVATDRAAQATEARATITLDGTPPSAVLTTPAEGAFVGTERPVTGTASDTNLASWKLEMAPGAAASAFQWSELATGTATLTAAELAALAPLPTNGLQTLRLTVRDRADQESSTLRTFTVDTVPPPSPAPLTGVVERTAAPTADVRLTWTAVDAPDLAGYLLSRDGARLTPAPVTAITFTDSQRPDGRYAYSVVAVDHAGNESAPATATVRVDLTAPIAGILAPLAGATVSGTVDVRGTAFSPDDFKEYRLRVGAGASPTSWTLLNRSTLTVSGGLLGSWTAGSDGPHVLALEAEDVAGNVARATVAVTVDGQAPSAPALTSLVVGAAPNTLRSTWTASPETDVDGYLVYRNGRIANAPGVVIGSLRAFLLPGPSYDDPTLPDGRQCYRVAAMDRADNLSPLSNELCQTLDNRRPHALILEPAAGTRFEFPIRVLADTPDRDAIAVQFQHKPHAEAAWLPLGAPDAQEPFEATFDPAGLAPGQYDLRAVARDAGGEDPAPASITVTFGDTTPPPVPEGLVALVSAADVRITWTAVSASDLQGYHVYRGEERLTSTPIAVLAYDDPGRSLGTHLYRVSAVDQDGNESARSEPREGVVYAVALDAPFPVTAAATADLPGSGARESTTVEIRRDAAVIAEAPAAAGGAFSAAGVPLQGGPNLLRAQARDSAGNRSIPSSEVVLIANTAPAAVTGLQAAAAGLAVDLSWAPVADIELFGYAIRRGSTDLTPSAPQQTAASITASSSAHLAYQAFDGDPGTAWIPQSFDAAPTWTVTFPEAVLVEKVALSFVNATVSGYRIEVGWEGRFLPVARVSANTEADVVHVLPSAFATDTLRVVLAPGGSGLAEVAISKRALVAAGTAAFHDPVTDGRYAYEVAAVDRYGAQGPAASVDVAVGDVTAPAPPTGLAATVEASDVLLTWNANTEPDLAHYMVRRDGSPIATVPTPQFRDVGRPNGTYVYTVLAVDQAGNASDPSAPASVVVAVAPPAAPVLSASPVASGAVALVWTHAGAAGFAVHRAATSGGPYAPIGRTGDVRSFLDATAEAGAVHFYVVHAEDAQGNPSPASNEASATPQRTAPPAAPVILFPTDAANPIELALTETLVAGQAEASSVVSIEADGALAGITLAGPGFAERSALFLLQNATSLAISADGRRAAYAFGAGDRLILWTDVAGPAGDVFAHPGGGDTEPAALSPDGGRLAYRVRQCAGGPCAVDLFLVELPPGDATPVETGPESAGDAAFSPAGDRLAFVSESGACQVLVRDLASGQTTPVASGFVCRHPRWSPDGTRLAFLAQTAPGAPHQLRIVALATLALVTVEDVAWPGSAPAWTADGGAVAYTSAASPRLRLRQFELAGGLRRDLTDPASSSFDPRFDPQGGWLSFSTWEAGVQKTFARRLDRGTQREVDSRAGVSAPEALPLHAWTGRQDLTLSMPDRIGLYPAEGRFEVDGVRLRPGQNTLVAFANEPEAGLTSPASPPIQITVPAGLHADLAVAADDLSTYPAVPLIGQPTRLGARIRNLGDTAAVEVLARLTLRDAAGNVVWQQEAQLSEIPAGGSASVSAEWTPEAADSYGLRVELDPGDTVAEAREDNNRADRGVYVVVAGVAVEVRADRDAYAARSPAIVTVRLANGGPAGQFIARATVEALDGTQVALLDSRPVPLTYGQQVEYTLPWNTGTVYAGDYAFRVRVEDGEVPAEGARPFRILPDLSATARIVGDRAEVPAGSSATFVLTVRNTGANTPLEQAVARLHILPEGSPTPVYTTDPPLPRLLPGGGWDGPVSWPQATPAGAYKARIEIVRGADILASAATSFRVTGAAPSLGGLLELDPAHLLAGDGLQAHAVVTNRGTTAVTAQAFAVEVTAGGSTTPLARQVFTLDLAPGETKTASVTLPTAALGPGLYPVFLRSEPPTATLDRETLQVHGALTPPTIDSPAVGATVPTSHPVLRVSNAVGGPGAVLTYQFQLFSDAGLTQPLPGAGAVAETPLFTSWRVALNLSEDRTYYWRARAGDGFSFSPWTAVGSFTVDERNEPPSTPVPDSPLPGARVPSREPLLVVTNADDPEREPLTYEFRLASDAPMSAILASAAGIPSGFGFTSWRVPITLDENAVYYWSARAHDGVHVSPWSAPVSFRVDTADEAPSAPVPLRPVAEEVAQLQPALVIVNGVDPEGETLTYRFEIDVVPTFDSAALQASPFVAQAQPNTAWTPPQPLGDNTRYYWRAASHDGQGASGWAGAEFFVNLANDPPGVPVPIHPPDQGIVTTATPTLRVRSASDADGDELTYEFAVTDIGGSPVAGVAGVPSGGSETSWTLTTPLAENARFRWTVRASDGEASGGWTAPQDFRVNAVPDPPTAPALLAPPEGALVDTPRPALVVTNATSPEGLPLTYTFELYAVGAGEVLTLVDRVDGVIEDIGQTQWTATPDLADGLYSWRARAADPSQPGPWMPSARFRVLLDAPPAPPTGLHATPGDGSVHLTWNASPEADLTGYRVHRSTVAGGPYTPIASPGEPVYDDTGLANGVTVHYVVTARDAHSESAYSAEVAATPVPAVLPAEVRYTPASIRGECIVRVDHTCPTWLYATAELPAGYDPSTIVVATVRLGGEVAPDPNHHPLVDSDQDGILEMQLRFRFSQARTLLTVGVNTLSLSGSVEDKAFRGQGTLSASALDVKLRMTPRTLNRSSQGQTVQARLDFVDPVYAADVVTATLRLNETVPIERVVSSQGLRLTVKFNRDAVVAVLPLGDEVEVRVSGTVGGVPFVAVDHIRVIQ